MAKQKEEMRKNKQKSAFGFRIVVICLMIVIIILLLLQRCSVQETENALEEAIRAQLGQLEGKSEAEIQDELNRVVDEGMFHIVINPEPIFYDGASEGNLEIENVPNNHYAMVVQLMLEQSGEVVYDSGLIYPNYHIQSDVLDVNLKAGEYPAAAVFYAYDRDTLKEVGTTSCQIVIRVQN